MVDIPRSQLDLRFCYARYKQCAELAKISSSVPSIRTRLEALAQEYLNRAIELKSKERSASPPLAPDHPESIRQPSLIDPT